MENPCFFCGSPFHPNTGSVYKTSYKGEEKITTCCYSCTQESLNFVSSWTGKKVGKKKVQTKESFYQAATNQYYVRKE